MLYFDIRMIDSGALTVNAVVSATDPVWQEGDSRPSDGVQVDGRLSVAGPGRYYFVGHMSGTTVVACRRCLTDVSTDVTDDVSAVFAEAGLDDAEEDDVYPVESGARSIDLRPLIREAWVLAAPRFVTCREECQGLCPICGIDRNVESCACRTGTTDSRWDALRALRDTSS